MEKRYIIFSNIFVVLAHIQPDSAVATSLCIIQPTGMTETTDKVAAKDWTFFYFDWLIPTNYLHC